MIETQNRPLGTLADTLDEATKTALGVTIPVPPQGTTRAATVNRAGRGPLNPTEVADRLHSDQNLIENFKDRKLVNAIKSMVLAYHHANLSQVVLGKFVASYDAATQDVRVAILESFQCDFGAQTIPRVKLDGTIDGEETVTIHVPPLAEKEQHTRYSLAQVLFYGQAELLANGSNGMGCGRLTNWIAAFRASEKIEAKVQAEERREELKAQGFPDVAAILKPTIKEAETKVVLPRTAFKFFQYAYTFAGQAGSIERQSDLRDFLIRAMKDAGFDPKKILDLAEETTAKLSKK